MAANLCTTEARRADWLRQVTAALCRASFAEFVKESWPLLESGELEWTEFQQAQCDTLQAFGEDWLAANAPNVDRFGALVARGRLAATPSAAMLATSASSSNSISGCTL